MGHSESSKRAIKLRTFELLTQARLHKFELLKHIFCLYIYMSLLWSNSKFVLIFTLNNNKHLFYALCHVSENYFWCRCSSRFSAEYFFGLWTRSTKGLLTHDWRSSSIQSPHSNTLQSKTLIEACQLSQGRMSEINFQHRLMKAEVPPYSNTFKCCALRGTFYFSVRPGVIRAGRNTEPI